MFENFGMIGIDNITAVDLVKGGGSFFVVAVGGTIIGLYLIPSPVSRPIKGDFIEQFVTVLIIPFLPSLSSSATGVIWGFLTGLVTRFTDHVRVIEPIFIFVMAYLAYLNAEIFHMSGIMA